MAEKNTHSILETIKKKLHKFDQKPEKGAKISDVSDEFEYIAPTKKPEAAATAPAPQENRAQAAMEAKKSEGEPIKFEDDLGLEDLNKTQEKTATPTSTKTPEPTQNSTATQSTEQNKTSNQNSAQPSAQAAEPTQTKDEKLDDFNLDDLDFDDESAAKKPAENSAAPTETKTSAQPSAAQTTSTDAASTATQNNQDFSEEDIEDYEDEVDFGEDIEGEVQDVETQEKPAENASEDPLEFAEEEQAATPPAANNSADDDLHFEEEAAPQAQTIQEQTSQTQTPQQTSSADDDLNFDDLELEESAAEPSVATKPAEKPLQNLDIAALEKEAEEQVKKQSEAKKSAAPVDEIDLEFEKELMGLKPEKPAESKAAPSITQNLSSQNSTEAKSAADELFSDLDSTKQTQNSAPINQPINQSPTSQMNSWLEQAPAQLSENRIIHDSTIIQTNESLKKLIDAKKLVAGISSFSQSPALQDLAIQLMEPKLEKWLNDNLPKVVEKIVSEEIKKIIPKE